MDGFDFSGLGDFGGGSSMGSYSDNPVSTPGDTSSFSNAGNNYNFSLPDHMTSMNTTASSFAMPSSGSPGIQTTSYNIGGQGAPTASSLAQGAANSPSSPMSAIAGDIPNAVPGTSQYTSDLASASGAVQGQGNPAPPPSSGSILDFLGLGTGNGQLDKSLFSGAIGGAGLATNLLMGSPSSSAEKSLKNIAGAQSAQGQQLENYLASGTLPPGAQQWVNQQTQANQAAIRSQYAASGLSGSSMEQAALAKANENATTQMFQIASSLLDAGINETNASGTLYNYLMQQQNADAKDVSSAIQNFVASLAGGGSGGQGLTLKVG